MISRRNIRVKVMQMLYALETVEDNTGKTDPVKSLKQKLDESSELFTYLVHFITRVARYAETDARLRASKNLVTEADRNVNTKIAGNQLLWKILENPGFKSAVSHYNLANVDDEDIVKKLYNELVASDIYKSYIQKLSRENPEEKTILQYIFTDLMLPDDGFTSFIEEQFANWQDDAEMMQQLVLGYLSKPTGFEVATFVTTDKWQFARELLTSVLNKRDYVVGLIKPRLKNWDAERIAVLDMILLQLGVCELLYFETIPPKVTINEYIDIAKEYSTEQSGHFVNGILDAIHKDLLREDKIHKIAFKQNTNG
jgi:N utilization substance protein B